jgi:hypothetical protein
VCKRLPLRTMRCGEFSALQMPLAIVDFRKHDAQLPAPR